MVIANGPSGEAIILAEWLLLTVSASMIAARLYLRLKINHQKFALSDACICLAWCAAMATVSFDIVFFRMNVLRPDVDGFLNGYHGDRKTATKYFWMSNTPFFTSFYLSKATLLAFYWQITPIFMKGRRYFLYIVIAYCAVGYIVTMLLNLFLCFPIHRNWAVGPSACYGPQGIVFQTAWAFNFSADLLIFLLPFTFLYMLKLKGAVLIGVYCIFGLGIINMAFSITRLLSIKLAPHNSSGTVPITLIELWSCLDMIIGVLIATLPSLRPYLRMIRARPSKTAPNICDIEPPTKNKLAKSSFGRLDEETIVPISFSSGGEQTLYGELMEEGIITPDAPQGRRVATGKDLELSETKSS